jgi:hypothetical protein
MRRAHNESTTRLAPVAVVATLAAIVASPTATAAAGQGGKPVVEREVVEETFFDEYILDICGVETNTTFTQRSVVKTFPDGSRTVHTVARWVPDDPTIASELDARTDIFASDGTQTVKGLAIKVYRKGEGTIIRDAGWVRFLQDGVLFRGPHPFLETDPAEVFC